MDRGEAVHKVPKEEQLMTRERQQVRLRMNLVGLSRTEMSGGLLLVPYALIAMLVNAPLQNPYIPGDPVNVPHGSKFFSPM